MGISVVRTLEFVALKPSEVAPLHCDVTAPVPRQTEPSVSAVLPVAPATRIILETAPLRLVDSLRLPVVRVLVFSVLSLLAAALVWLLLR